jgi:hypothetical protein
VGVGGGGGGGRTVSNVKGLAIDGRLGSRGRPGQTLEGVHEGELITTVLVAVLEDLAVGRSESHAGGGKELVWRVKREEGPSSTVVGPYAILLP